MQPNKVLIKKFKQTFANQPKPGPLVDECFPESPDIQKTLAGIDINSQGIQETLLEQDNALIFLNEWPFRYFLPIYCLYFLNGFDELLDSLLYAFTQRDLTKFEVDQLELFYLALHPLLVDHNYSCDKDQIASALENIWNQIELKTSGK